MEINLKSVFNKLSIICSVFPYYDYADRGLKVIRQLCKGSYEALNIHYDAITYCLPKRALIIKNFNNYTATALERGFKYRGYSFDLQLKNSKVELPLFYEFYVEHPTLIIKRIKGDIEDDNLDVFNGIYDILTSSRQIQDYPDDIFKVLDVFYFLDPYDNPDVKYIHDGNISYVTSKTSFTNGVNLNLCGIEEGNYSINLKYEKLILDLAFLDIMDKIKFESQEFVESVTSIVMRMEKCDTKISKMCQLLQIKFPNLISIEYELKDDKYGSIYSVISLLSFPFIKSVSRKSDEDTGVKIISNSKDLSFEFECSNGFSMEDNKIYFFIMPEGFIFKKHAEESSKYLYRSLGLCSYVII